MALYPIINNPTVKNGTVIKKTVGRVGCMLKLITIEKTSMSGLLIAVRIIIINDI